MQEGGSWNMFECRGGATSKEGKCDGIEKITEQNN